MRYDVCDAARLLPFIFTPPSREERGIRRSGALFEAVRKILDREECEAKVYVGIELEVDLEGFISKSPSLEFLRYACFSHKDFHAMSSFTRSCQR